MTLLTNKTTGDTIEAAEWNESATRANTVESDINQGVKDTDIPTTSGTKYTPKTAPAYLEGEVFYDSDKKALSYYNDINGVTIPIGQRIVFRVENQTGGLLTKGTVVYPDETTVIGLADAKVKRKSRVIAVLAEDIADTEMGFVIKSGSLEGINTLGFTPGQIVHLGWDTDAGKYVGPTPDDGGFHVTVGVIDIVDEFEGSMTVDINSSELTVEVTDTNGFPSDQRTATTISFVDGTRTFDIAPTGTAFHFYELGIKYEKTTNEEVIIDDISGNHAIYYDEGVLTAAANPSQGQIDTIIRTKCLVSIIYWNATDSLHHILNDERHGISMSPDTHAYLHFTRGAQYLSGLAVEDILIGNGSLDSHAQFGITSGNTTDEDLFNIISSVTSTTGFPYLYRSGAAGDWTKGTNAGFAFPTGVTPLPQYNEFTGATYQLSEITSGDYMLIHIFTTNDTSLSPFAVVGNNQYSLVSSATIAAEAEIGAILANLPVPEFLPIASVIIEGKTSFTNSVQSRVVQTSLGDDYLDWRTSELQAGATASNHNNLAGLQLANTAVTWGHIDDQAQTIYGAKTFNSIPIVPGLTSNDSIVITSIGAGGLKIDSTNDSRIQIYKGNLPQFAMGYDNTDGEFKIERGELLGVNDDFLLNHLTGEITINNGLIVNNGLIYNHIKRTETAGESLVTGNVCYLKSDGKYWKSDATAEVTASTEILIANGTIAADATGEFIENGVYTTTGLTAGSIYYLSETTAAYTTTAPTTSLSIVRIVGYAKSTTELQFRPDTLFVENA